MNVLANFWNWLKAAFANNVDDDDDVILDDLQSFGMGRFVGDTTSLCHDNSFVDDF